MKKRGILFLTSLFIFSFCISVQASPILGTYDSRNNDFEAGDWQELLLGCKEGAIGNQIAAGNDRDRSPAAGKADRQDNKPGGIPERTSGDGKLQRDWRDGH